MTLSKKMQNVLLMKAHEQLFACPVCASSMKVEEDARLQCASGHSFDIAKSGYVNLSPASHTTKYGADLFEARKIVMSSPFFEPVIKRILSVLNGQPATDQMRVLDAGCGEGSHLASIISKTDLRCTGIGIDLSKEGIMAAAKSYPGHIWAVADLAAIPAADASADAIFNILSPANFAEFTRVLKPGGLMLKIVPESGYLQELREVFGKERQKDEETDPYGRFGAHFTDVQTERITYRYELPHDMLPALLRMTPLTWTQGEDGLRRAIEKGIPEITVDVQLMTGRR